MADYTNAEILAAWLVHAKHSSPDSRLIPTEAETAEILKQRPEHFEEAHALATVFVKRAVKTEPRTIVESTQAWLEDVNAISEKFGGFLSARPPPRPPRRLPAGGKR